MIINHLHYVQICFGDLQVPNTFSRIMRQYQNIPDYFAVHDLLYRHGVYSRFIQVFNKRVCQNHLIHRKEREKMESLQLVITYCLERIFCKFKIWDEELATKAGKWASRNKFEHNPDRTIRKSLLQVLAGPIIQRILILSHISQPYLWKSYSWLPTHTNSLLGQSL